MFWNRNGEQCQYTKASSPQSLTEFVILYLKVEPVYPQSLEILLDIFFIWFNQSLYSILFTYFTMFLNVFTSIANEVEGEVTNNRWKEWETHLLMAAEIGISNLFSETQLPIL